jgi:hypothetical protein
MRKARADTNTERPFRAVTIGQPIAMTNTAQNKTIINNKETVMRELINCMHQTSHPYRAEKRPAMAIIGGRSGPNLKPRRGLNSSQTRGQDEFRNSAMKPRQGFLNSPMDIPIMQTGRRHDQPGRYHKRLNGGDEQVR